jgi:hypothetical protein
MHSAAAFVEIKRQVMINNSRLAFIAAVATMVVASPAFAQDLNAGYPPNYSRWGNDNGYGLRAQAPAVVRNRAEQSRVRLFDQAPWVSSAGPSEWPTSNQGMGNIGH